MLTNNNVVYIVQTCTSFYDTVLPNLCNTNKFIRLKKYLLYIGYWNEPTSLGPFEPLVITFCGPALFQPCKP